MQRKKNIRLLISLIVIVFFAVLLVTLNNSKRSSFVDKDLFQIENLDWVDRVLLKSPGVRTELKFNGTRWFVNEKFEADEQMIKVLFATLKQTLAKRQVAVSLQDSLKKEISTHGIKVSSFIGGALVKEFLTLGNKQKNETYFQGKDGNVYLVAIPGYRVLVASVFELPANGWRNKQVFNFNWQNIKDLEVTFPSDAKQNFKASFSGKYFSVEGIATDTTKLDQFMDALLQLRSETILDSVQAKRYDSLIKHKPMMSIVIHDIAKRSYPLTVFPIQKGQDFLIGGINEEIVLLNPLTVRGIYRKKEFFVSK
jgi:hypothetical protein